VPDGWSARHLPFSSNHVGAYSTAPILLPPHCTTQCLVSPQVACCTWTTKAATAAWCIDGQGSSGTAHGWPWLQWHCAWTAKAVPTLQVDGHGSGGTTRGRGWRLSKWMAKAALRVVDPFQGRPAGAASEWRRRHNGFLQVNNPNLRSPLFVLVYRRLRSPIVLLTVPDRSVSHFRTKFPEQGTYLRSSFPVSKV
jgi:hypothetical protein